MSTSYDGSLGTTVNVIPRGADVSVGFNSTIVLVGEGDSGTADLQEGYFIEDTDDAEGLFGEEAPLVDAFGAARANGAPEIWGVPVDSTDPNYEAAVETAVDLGPRYIYVDSEDDADVNAAVGVVEDRATDLDLTRVFAPISEDVDVADIGEYEPRADSQRLVEVAPLTATVAGADTYMAAAIVGAASTKPLGSSLAYDGVVVDELGTEYRASMAVDFERVTAVTKDAEVVDGITTSDEGAFSDIFQMEIVDTAILGLDEVAQDYGGSEVNTPDGRANLESDMRIFLQSLASQTPPLLADAFGGDPFVVEADVGGDADEVIVTAGVNPVDVMKQITINLNIGRVTTLGGIEADE